MKLGILIIDQQSDYYLEDDIHDSSQLLGIPNHVLRSHNAYQSF